MRENSYLAVAAGEAGNLTVTMTGEEDSVMPLRDHFRPPLDDWLLGKSCRVLRIP